MIVPNNIFNLIVQSIPKQFLILFAIILVLVVVVFILNLFRSKEQRYKYLYERREFIMSHSEREFFIMLTELIGANYWVFPQIHLPSIVGHKIKGQSWFGAFRHISEKSVDFTLCDKKSLQLAMVIELDDPSHERVDRIERDKEVERILESAKLPLLRVKTEEIINREELLRKINEKLFS